MHLVHARLGLLGHETFLQDSLHHGIDLYIHLNQCSPSRHFLAAGLEADPL